MRRASSTIVALIAVVVMIATSCSATETVTVLESARAASTTVAQEEPTAESGPADDDLIELAEDPSDAASVPATTGDGETGDGDRAATVQAGDSACTYLGVDSFDDMQIELQLTSDLDVQADVSVDYTVWDGDRSVLVESTHSMEDLAPGEPVRMSIDTVTNPPANDDEVSCTVGELTNIDGAGDSPLRAAAGDSCRFVEVDFANDVQIEVMLANPLDEAAELVVDFAVRSSSGIRFSDGVAYSDQVEPGELATLQIDTFDELPTWAADDEIECTIVAIEQY